MGLLDGILGNVLGGLVGGSGGGVRTNNSPLGSVLGRAGGGLAAGALMTLALRVLEQNGGISGLVEKFRGSGLGREAASWVSTDKNMPITADQVRSTLGPEELARIAQKLGLTPDQASQGLAQVLPELVNEMTPQGQVPNDDRDEIADALAKLSGRKVG